MLRVGVINHGCPKNLVDTEVMLGFIEQAGYKTTLDIEKSDIVETELEMCGYFCIITSAKMTAKEALELYKSRDAS